jgi:hypothetical protein
MVCPPETGSNRPSLGYGSGGAQPKSLFEALQAVFASHEMIDSALKSKRGSTVDALTGNDTANHDDKSIEYM